MHAVAFMMLQSQSDIARAQAMLPAFMAAFLLIGIVCLLIIIIPFWFICKKAGFSPWLSLLNIIPLGTLILCYVLAFADWNVAPVPPAGWMPPTPYPPPPPQA